MRFLREVSGTLLSRGLSSLIGFGTSVLVARALQPQGKGVYSTMTATVDLALALGTVGAGKSLTYLTAAGRWPRDQVLAAGSGLALFNGLLVGALVLAAGAPLRGLVLPDLGSVVVLAALPLAIGRVLFTYAEGVARGLRQILACNRALVLQSATTLLLIAALAGAGSLSPPTALLALAGGALVATAVTAGVAMHGAPTPRLSAAFTSDLFRYGLGYQTVGLLQMIHYRADMLLVGHWAGAQGAGWYSTAANLAQTLWNVPIAVSFVIMPWIASKEAGAAAEGTAACARLALWTTAGLGLLLGLLAAPLVTTVFGEAYLPAVGSLRLLLPGIVMNSLLLVLGGSLMGRGRIRPLVLISAGSMSLNLALNAALLPRFDIAGAAAASSVTYSLSALLTLWWTSRDTRRPAIDFLWPRGSDLQRLISALSRKSG